MISFKDLETGARTLYGEARGEPYQGKVGIAWVMRTRLENPGWWSRDKADDIPDDTLEAVCRDPKQFSCWDDHNREKLEAVSADDPVLAECVQAMLDVFAYNVTDPTKGATHYYAHALVTPSWYAKAYDFVVIGRHTFCKVR